MIFLALFTIPFIVLSICFFVFKKEITFSEFLAQIGIQILVVIVSIHTIYKINVHDVEIWNGFVVSKAQVKVSCGHSYSCNCYSSCDSNNNCHEVCSTCYEHNHDYDWRVYSSLDKYFNINRIDRQGTKEPPRYTHVKINDPVSIERNYENYIKSSHHSLFKRKMLSKEKVKEIPKYPNDIHDYYKLNRFIANGVEIDINPYNTELSLINSRIGAKKETNLIIVLTNKNEDFYEDLVSAWDGSKQNDVVVVIGVEDNLNIKWNKMWSYSKNNLFGMELNDAILNEKIFKLSTLSVIEKVLVDYHHRDPMTKYEYLKSSIIPTKKQFIVALIIGLLVSGLLVFIFKNTR